MSIDLSQFHQVFFEESFEGLDAMESALMELDPSAVDAEVINTIFRSAHSIKGGSATFGFSGVADFTHVLETLLDEIRAETRAIRPQDIDLFLQSVDCLRELIEALQNEEEADTSNADSLKAAFEAILAGDNTGSNAVPESVAPAAAEDEAAEVSDVPTASDKPAAWQIFFKPEAGILRTGNDPLRMFRELAELGRLQVVAEAAQLPTFALADPEDCWLAWSMQLQAQADKATITQADIEEVFEWVLDECQLDITPITVTDAEPAAKSAKSPAIEVGGCWKIFFKPGTDILRTGNEPLRILRELAEMGALAVDVLADEVPEFSQLDPEGCYLAWDLSLSSDAEQRVIEEVFEWVVDESELRIERVAAKAGAPVQPLIEVLDAAMDAAASVPTPIVAAAEVIDGPLVAPVPVPAAKAKPAAKKTTGESSSIRVGIDKIDDLINMVGELVITQSMLGQLGEDFEMDNLPKLLAGLGQLEHNTRELQESVMRIRMLPISFAFSRFPRMVRDLSKRLEKEIDLELRGEQTELDKTVMEKIGDPLVHLVRNSIDHGIESPAERLAAGKDTCGSIILNAYHQGGNVVIEIIDDGKGLDRERIAGKAVENGMLSAKEAANLSDEQVNDLIFHAGFSTASEVSDVSGRGVGMDVVRRNIQELNGTVEIASKAGQGSTITIRLPLTLAILDGQLVRVGRQTYIFQLVSIVESLQIKQENVSKVAGGCDVFKLRDEYVPIVRLYDVFNVEPDTRKIEESLLVVVENDGEKIGIVVDDLEAQQQVVIKSLESNYRRVEGISGATILGDGTVALILDVPGMVKIAGINHRSINQVTSLSQSYQVESRAV